MTLRQEIDRDVSFGVYALVSRRVRVHGSDAAEAAADSALKVPPADVGELKELGRAIAGSDHVTTILET